MEKEYLDIEQFKVVNQVRQINYPCLNFLNGNRELNETHVKELKEAIISGDKMPAVIVDKKTLYILDGQHRYEAFCRALEEGYEVTLDVIFESFEEDLVEYARKYNCNMLNWCTKDYIFSGIACNKTQYILLEQFCRTRKYLMRGNRPKYESAIVLLFGNTLDSGVKNLPEITDQNIKNGSVRYTVLELVVDRLGEQHKVAFFKKGAIKGLLKLFYEIGDVDSVKDFIMTGINNRFCKPTKDGVNIWYQYYRNMYDSYLSI